MSKYSDEKMETDCTIRRVDKCPAPKNSEGSGPSCFSHGKDEFTEALTKAIKDIRKQFCENGNMDMMKLHFEEEIKKVSQHQGNVDQLRNLMSKGDRSYEDVYRELGGPDLNVDASADLDTILKKLVEMDHIKIPEEDKKALFKQWDEMLSPQK